MDADQKLQKASPPEICCSNPPYGSDLLSFVMGRHRVTDSRFLPRTSPRHLRSFHNLHLSPAFDQLSGRRTFSHYYDARPSACITPMAAEPILLQSRYF